MSGQPRNHRFELETLSPVRVGAGQDAVLSPYTDFVQEGGHLVYLDPRKLERALAAQSMSVMDEFARGVRSRMNNTRSDFELADFICTRLGTTPAALALRRVPVGGAVRHAQVRRHISNGGQPYIPGSSLKGAFRAAILYCWLLDSQEGHRFVEELAVIVERLWQAFGRQIEEAERHYREGNIREGDRLAGSIPNRVRPELRPFSEERLFGGLTGGVNGPEMRFFRLSDTVPLPADVLQVAEVTRIKLFNAQTVSPQWSEVLPRGVRTTFALSIEPRFTRPDLRFLNDESVEPLLERLDRFAADCVEWEMDVLDNLSVDALNDVYNEVLGVEERDLPQQAARMRLGAGKTYFDNSLGLSLHRHDFRIFERFRRLLGLGRNPQFRRFSSERFPATRSYVIERGRPTEPLGWVQIRAAG
ncbi:MAG TPA: type III-A CRISPR-associated RAMP protein Csm5 [Longimicrobiaceae bacterium]|nr:type III-A CRISPR-associated RAMP protein Csm5 [Longimicrobiaceae bacterium]